MAFEKINVKKIVKEKRKNALFNEEYEKIKRHYELIEKYQKLIDEVTKWPID